MCRSACGRQMPDAVRTPLWAVTARRSRRPDDAARTLRPVTRQFSDGPPAHEAEALLIVQRRVARAMAVVSRLDVGPRPEVSSGPAIHAANHRSMADLLLSTGTFSRWGWPIRPLVAGAYFDRPGIGGLLERLRCIPVQGTEALDLASKALEQGWSVAIMPEGRIVSEDEWGPTGVGRAHPGIGRLAIDTGLPVVANGASGTERFWPRGRAFPRVRPGHRYHLALCSEVVGVVHDDRARDATTRIMDAVARCVVDADRITGRIT